MMFPVTTISIASLGLFGFLPAICIFTYSGIDAGFGELSGGGGGGLVINLIMS